MITCRAFTFIDCITADGLRIFTIALRIGRGGKKGWKEETTEPLEAQLDCEVSGTAPVRNGTILVDKCCTGRAINVEIFIAGFVADKLHHSSLPQYTHGHGHQKGGSALQQRFASLLYCIDGEKLCLPNNIELF